MRRLPVAVVVGCVLALLGAVVAWSYGFPADAERAVSATFTENGVAVEIGLTLDSGEGVLTATFAPQDAGFHLYSVDLPDQGVDGVGRPTKIDLDGTLTATGPPVASAQARQVLLPESNQPVPVYPDGPVTLTVPVRATGTGDAVARFTYAACSEKAGCNIPVEKRAVGFVVTDDAITRS